MFGNIILESAKNYITNSNIEICEKYEIIISSKIVKTLFIKTHRNLIFILSKIKSSDLSQLKHIISEKIKTIKGKICIIYISDLELIEQNNEFMVFINNNKRINSLVRIDTKNGNVFFSTNKEMQNQVFSERYTFLLHEYNFALRVNWQNEMNDFYDACFEVGKK